MSKQEICRVSRLGDLANALAAYDDDCPINPIKVEYVTNNGEGFLCILPLNTVGQQAIAGPDDGLKPCLCNTCESGFPVDDIRKVEKDKFCLMYQDGFRAIECPVYKPTSTASAIAGRCTKLLASENYMRA